MNKEKELLKEISEFLSKQGHFKPYDTEESDNLIAKIKEYL
tara:strand:- start:655 stop:777 length:123 start_codon:yes stop_codon:yes gene_type:complete